VTEDSTTINGQTILEHLNEFRVRLTWAVGGLVVATVISFAFTEQLLEFLIKPYGEQLQTLSPTEGIETYFKVALMSGVIISMPWILYQLWLFIAPGLHEHERRYVYIFVPSATFLFLLGVAFAWLILLPGYLLGTMDEQRVYRLCDDFPFLDWIELRDAADNLFYVQGRCDHFANPPCCSP